MEEEKATVTDITRALGERLRRLRGAKSTQEMSAIFATTKKSPDEKTDTDSWANWEKGVVPWFPFNTIVRIADYFGVTTDWLLGRATNEEQLRMTADALARCVSAKRG